MNTVFTESQKARFETLLLKYNLEALFLFGSSVRGDEHTQSDVDVAYVTKTPLLLKQLFDLQTDLKNIFDTTREIDLVSFFTASPLLRHKIMIEGMLLAGSNRTEARLFESTMMLYIDTKPLRELSKQYIQDYVAR